MGGRIFVRMGDIFEGATDLTVLPCSSKGTISSASARWKTAFGILTPKDMNIKIDLGTISRIHEFPGPKTTTRYYCWAASLLNDQSSSEVIENIGREIGAVTTSREDLRIVEVPLLGTGAGGLGSEVSAKALSKGFSESSHSDSTLFMFVYDQKRFKKLSTTLSEGRWGRAWASIQIKPGMFGLAVDLKRLLGQKSS